MFSSHLKPKRPMILIEIVIKKGSWNVMFFKWLEHVSDSLNHDSESCFSYI